MPLSRRDVAIALSLANLCFARVWMELLSVSGTEAYFLDVANADLIAAVTNVLLTAGLFLGATALARRHWRHGRTVVIAGFVGVIVLRLSGLGPELAPGVFAVADRWRDGRVLEALAPVAAVALIAALASRWPARALRTTVGIVYALTPFVAVTFGRALWIVAALDPTVALAGEAPAIGSPVPDVKGPRVVVMVMDALGRRHAIDARPDSVDLPELDRLRAQSIDATQVTQIANKTIIAVPAMLSGLDVDASEPIARDELLLTVDGATIPWSEAPNLLRDAQALGGVAIVAGWYHPYCRLFPELDGCSSFPTRTVGSRARYTGFWRALRDQQLALLPYVNLRIRQIDIVRAQQDDALAAVTLGGRGLVFLHLIAPHTPWIWDAATESFTLTEFSPDGYYGNIQLMDRVLGELRREMELAGKWDSTAVLLLSDHVMRYRPDYLDEPEDDRVPFVLKLPGQARGVTYDRPFSAIVTHELVEALLRGDLRTEADVTAWLDARVDAKVDATDPPAAR